MNQSVAWSMSCGVSVADLFVHIRGITDRNRVVFQGDICIRFPI